MVVHFRMEPNLVLQVLNEHPKKFHLGYECGYRNNRDVMLFYIDVVLELSTMILKLRKIGDDSDFPVDCSINNQLVTLSNYVYQPWISSFYFCAFL